MPPEDGDGLEPPAADPEFGAREDIVARPQPGFQCGGIGFRQTAPPHLRRRRGVLVVEQMVLDEDPTGGRPKCADQTRGVPSFAGIPTTPALCQRRP